MTVLSAILLGLAMGWVFGFALEKSRVFEPAVILGQMQLRNFTMLKIFLSAVATGLVVLSILTSLGLTKLHPKATLYAADVLGGLLLGGGIAIAGACPGTVLAQIGVGYRDAWWTLAGGLSGALGFALLEPLLRPLLLTGGPGKLTLDRWLDVPFAVPALGLAGLLVAILVVLERWRPWQSELGAQHDGLLPPQPVSQPSAAPITPALTSH